MGGGEKIMSYNEREGKSIFLSLASSAFKQNRNRCIERTETAGCHRGG